MRRLLLAFACLVTFSRAALADVAVFRSHHDQQTLSTATGTCGTASTGAVHIYTTNDAVASIDLAAGLTGTVQFNASTDGANYFAVTATPIAGGAPVSTTTASGRWTLGVSPYVILCVNITAFTSGSAVLALHASSAPSTMTPAASGQATTGTAGVTMLNAVAVTGASTAFVNANGYTAHDIQITTTGAPTYTIAFQGSLDNSNWNTLDQITSSTTTPNYIGSAGYYPYLRLNLTAISGGTLTALYSGAVYEAPQVSIVGQTAGKTGVQSLGVDGSGNAQNIPIQGNNSVAPSAGAVVDLVGRYDSSLPTLVSGNVAAPQLTVDGRLLTSSTSVGSSTAGTGVACNSGTSPCTLSNSAQNILSANTSRKACSVCTAGTVDAYCKRNTVAGSAATSSSFDFMLNAGSAALKIGQCWPCDSPGGTWQGALNCIASGVSAATNLSVSETN